MKLEKNNYKNAQKIEKIYKQTAFEDIYEVVRHIPRGRVTSYSAIAQYIGKSKAARMVGWAMNLSHTVIPPVPAHRVVNYKGILTGSAHFYPPSRMKTLLESEGITIKNNTVQDFQEVFWDPSISLL